MLQILPNKILLAPVANNYNSVSVRVLGCVASILNSPQHRENQLIHFQRNFGILWCWRKSTLDSCSSVDSKLQDCDRWYDEGVAAVGGSNSGWLLSKQNYCDVAGGSSWCSYNFDWIDAVSRAHACRLGRNWRCSRIGNSAFLAAASRFCTGQ